MRTVNSILKVWFLAILQVAFLVSPSVEIDIRRYVSFGEVSETTNCLQSSQRVGAIDLSEKIESFLHEYKDIVSYHVNIFQSTWVRHSGMTKIPVLVGNTTGKNKPIQDPFKTGMQDYFESEPSMKDLHYDVEWDNEDDPSKYLDDLISYCSKSKTKSPSFSHFKKCWRTLHSLIHKPFCTTRFDSRVICSGSQKSSLGSSTKITNQTSINGIASWHEKGVKIIQEHLSLNTLNIVILGAGPSGLALANALTELQQDPTSPWYVGNRDNLKTPDIRVLLFENRLEKAEAVDSPGRKKGYDRNWITDLRRDLFIGEGLFDPRLGQFLTNIHELQQRLSLPINAIETLLLLSNRDRSHVVKVLYDDFRNYMDEFKQVSNMIVVDATGHRLNSLRRPAPDASSKGVDSFEYIPDSLAKNVMKYFRSVSQSHLQILKEHKQPMTIAAYDTSQAPDADCSGVITYPILPQSKMPYYMSYAKISSFAYHNHQNYDNFGRNHYIKESDRTWNRDSPLCGIQSYDQSIDGLADKWCGPHFNYEMSTNYNTDFATIMRNIPFEFASRSFILNLTQEQAQELREIAFSYSRRDAIILNEFPILSIPPREILQKHEALKKNDVDNVLLSIMETELNHMNSIEKKTYADTALKNDAKLSFFEYHPYIYQDPVYYNEFFGNVPIVRLGNSLLSGDVNGSTGLEIHFFIILRLKCRLMMKNKDECKRILSQH